MPKRDEHRSEPQPNQRLPKGHFDSDGVSQGKRDGPCRPTPNAYQGPRERGESTPAKREY